MMEAYKKEMTNNPMFAFQEHQKFQLSLVKGKLRSYVSKKDIIKIGKNEDARSLIDWFNQKEENSEMVRFVFGGGFPLLEGSILIEMDLGDVVGTDRVSFQVIDDNTVMLEKYLTAAKDGNQERLIYSCVLKNPLSDDIDVDWLFHTMTMEDAEDNLTQDFFLLLSVFSYMVFHQDDRYIEKQRVVAKSKKQGKKNAKSTRSFSKVVYTFKPNDDPELLHLEQNEKREYIRQTGSWTRKGHFRTITLKDGSKKTTWIKPQIVKAQTGDVNKEQLKQGIYQQSVTAGSKANEL